MLVENALGTDFERRLERFLRGRACLLGIGSEWWHDEGAGPHIAQALESRPELHAIDTGFVPEDFLETVARDRPDTILLVDATNFGAEPGEVMLMEPAEITDAGMFTHAVTLRMLADGLKKLTGARIAMLVIQPEDTSSGRGLSAAVAETVGILENMLFQVCDRKH